MCKKKFLVNNNTLKSKQWYQFIIKLKAIKYYKEFLY